MNPDLQHLIELQKLDDVIRGLEAEIADLPRKVAAIESQLSTHIRQVESDKQALAENQKSRRRREGEIAAARDKISHFKDQSLMVKTNEQYKALLHEIEHQETLIRQIEDQILGEMIESESLERKLREAEVRLAEERKQTQGEIAVAEERRRRDEQELGQVRAARSTIQGQIPTDIYETYERIARGRKGQAVVAVMDGTCGACHVHLRPQVFSEVISRQQLHTCESCGRILYYVAKTDSGLTDSPPSAETNAGGSSP
jgi:predicted  nucleic acid-binding Zn-ribbon protein